MRKHTDISSSLYDMDIQQLLSIFLKAPQTCAIEKILKDPTTSTSFLKGLSGSAASVYFASLGQLCGNVFLFILNDTDEAGYFYHDLTQIIGKEKAMFFPSSYRRQVKYGQKDAANEILRTEVLSLLNARKNSQATATPVYIVTHPEAICELVVSERRLDERSIRLTTGKCVDVNNMVRLMREFGFEEVDYVYEPGQFAMRGSIIDVYSYSNELPFRIDFFGDEIDSIRTFEVQSQLSKEKKQHVDIVPELAAISNERVPFTEFLPSDSVIVMRNTALVSDLVEQTYRNGFSTQAITERLNGATEMESHHIMQELRAESLLIEPSCFIREITKFKRIEYGNKATGTPQATIEFNTGIQPLFHKNFELLTQTFEDYVLKGYHLYILADSQKQNQRLRDIFNERDAARKGHDEPESTDLSKSEYASYLPFTPVEKTLHEGFIENDLKVCIFTDHQIFDRFHKYNLRSDAARSGKMALTLKELQEMEIGDYIVHVDFGIGKFAGLVRVPTGSSYQEMIRIVYQHNDKVDVSIHSLYKISKYKRHDSETSPRLSTLGTGAWDRLKERTKKKIKDIARDLIKLYAARRHEKGFAFSADSFLQHELEASFLYEDTPDQQKATNEVKADMESSRPMDRLVCGDVGFGKTEVAVRAAFKAACDSKQVAVLVPTTVLAYQHFQTFSSRLKNLPVRVDYLSRARSTKATKEVLADLEAGKIDIIIGTHKLISKTVKFKDLGLLIIDEEQKFGVSTKEKLRKMKTNVDTLTMSATPIPRTLQFSLMGARDMSIMQTPPPNRYPICTEIHSFDKEVIKDAIEFEMSRNGQVFFVNDRISNLPELKLLINKFVPDARVAIGHGQMKPEELEKIVMAFMNHDYDVLLSTTIVENGIDISNANTIIINDAHKFGLSDLHQMRGRVGRSNKKAFCYLITPPLSNLTQEARRRLEALETFSELGSGFNLSMQDLDIRGAGNLLGAEQSGFMEELGYETYQKILSQAIVELKNDEFGDMFQEDIAEGKKITGDEFVEDCAIESDLEMYFPDYYVPGSSERMLLYHELDSISNDSELDKYKKNLVDRFGDIPHEGNELLQIVPLRRIGKRLGCEKITLKQKRMQMQFVSNPMSAYYKSAAFGNILNYIADNPRQCNLKEINGKRTMMINDVSTVAEAVGILRKMEGA